MKITYRPEVDGLRALAVSSVVLYHGDFALGEKTLLPGGYLGVDIFFVISGYLIGWILLKELEESGRISIYSFYERRARRILPALFVVLTATLPFAYLYLFPADFVEFSESQLSTLLFGSNFYFLSAGTEYGGTEGDYLPLLHTWTLSVEEQFYLLFPLLLLLAFKFFKFLLPWILGIGLVGSLVVADVASRSQPALGADELLTRLFGFYGLHSRMWELLAGTLLAFVEVRQGVRLSTSPSQLTKILPSLGIILIVGSFLVFDGETRHPSIYTTIPVTGVCLVIWYGGYGDVISRLLASKVCVGLGLISYSLYLWHYPILVFSRLRERFINTGITDSEKALWIVVAILLSIATYFFVEKPFRDRNKMRARTIASFLVPSFLVLGATNLFVLETDGVDGRFADLYAFYDQKIEFDNTKLAKDAWRIVDSGDIHFTKSAQKKVLFLGDSHSRDLFNMFYLNIDRFPDLEFSRIFFRFIPDNYLEEAIVTESFAELSRESDFQKADMVVISDATLINQLTHLKTLVEFLKSSDKQVVMTSLSNVYEPHGRKLTLLDRMLLDRFYDGAEKDSTNWDRMERRNYRDLKVGRMRINERLKQIAANNEVPFLEKQAFLCDVERRRCDVITDEGRKVRYDTSHLSLEGAKYFGERVHRIGWFDYLLSEKD